MVTPGTPGLADGKRTNRTAGHFAKRGDSPPIGRRPIRTLLRSALRTRMTSSQTSPTRDEGRSATARAVLPDDLRGESVLDVGCGDGALCLEASRRGAGRVLGIDIDGESIREARRAAEGLGAPVEFAVRDVEREPLEESFDHVLCLDLLGDVRDPLGVLDRLVERTRKRLVLEVAGPRRESGRAAAWIRHRILSRSPVVTVGRSGSSHRVQGEHRFRFSHGALENLLLHQRGVFARLRSHPSADGESVLVVAERLRVGDLLLVAGPTSSGKSTLIEKIQTGDAPALCEHLGLSDGAAWPMMSAFDMGRQREPEVARALFHYDTLRPFMRSAHVHARDVTLDVLRTADRVRVLTIWTPPSVLRQRFDEEEARGKGRGKRRRKEIRRLFDDPDRVVDHYREWFAFCRSRGLDVTVVLPLEGMACIPVEQWERDHASAPEPAAGSRAVGGA